ncbi:MAG: hypothetical protein WBA46_14655 [Thermomicrobiales bacterium]
MPEQQRPSQTSMPRTTTMALQVGQDVRSPSLAERIARVTPLHLALVQWMACGVVVSVLLFPTLFSSLLTIPGFPQSGGAILRIRMWQRSFGFNPYRFDPLEPPETAFLLGILALAVILAFAVHAIAFWQVWSNTDSGSPRWHWLLGPVGSHIIMLFMAPMSADVFFYAMTGDMAATGRNPYLHALSEYPENPLFRYNHWVDMTSVYGPIWTGVNRVLMAITGPQPFQAVLAFKLLLGLSSLALAGVVWFVALRLTHSHRLALTAFILVAWQPNMILESSGQAHNDSFMLLLLVTGIGTVLVWGRRLLRPALAVAALSIGVKYVTLPIAGLVALLRLATCPHEKHRGWRITRSWALDALVLMLLAAVFIAPYWTGPTFFQEMVREPGRLFSNPIFQPRLRSVMREIGLGSTLHALQQGLPFIMQSLVVLFILREGVRQTRSMLAFGRTRSDESASRPRTRQLPLDVTASLLQSWMAITIALAMCTPNSHSWYLTWPVVPVALYLVVQRRRGEEEYRTSTMPNWVLVYLAVTALMTITSFQIS